MIEDIGLLMIIALPFVVMLYASTRDKQNSCNKNCNQGRMCSCK